MHNDLLGDISMELAAVPSESIFSMQNPKHDHNNFFLKITTFNIPSSNTGRNGSRSLLCSLIGINRFVYYQKQRDVRGYRRS
ncbi:hypothetical protein [[Eubacterium] cellulosolvens]